jgi:hypothetical protein
MVNLVLLRFGGTFTCDQTGAFRNIEPRIKSMCRAGSFARCLATPTDHRPTENTGVSLMASNRKNIDLMVGFIDYEDNDTDTILSFAIFEDGEYSESLILMQSTFDRLLTDDEQGTQISYGDILGDSLNPAMLQEASINDAVLELSCESHHFTLDLSKLKTEDLDVIERQLQTLNFDNRFTLRINGSEVQADTMEHTVVALCWYQPEEWTKLKQNAADAEILDDTYKDWKKNANDTIRLIREAGRQVQKINIKIDDLEAWCKAEDKDNNSAARTLYAIAIAEQRNNK